MIANLPFVQGTLVDITPTHFVTEDAEGRMTWNREYYRVTQEPEPQTEYRQYKE